MDYTFLFETCQLSESGVVDRLNDKFNNLWKKIPIEVSHEVQYHVNMIISIQEKISEYKIYLSTERDEHKRRGYKSHITRLDRQIDVHKENLEVISKRANTRGTAITATTIMALAAISISIGKRKGKAKAKLSRK